MKTRTQISLEERRRQESEDAESDEDDRWDDENIIVLADGVGGFKFSRSAIEWLANHGNVEAELVRIIGYGISDKYLDEFEIEIERHDPLLLNLISVMGEDLSSGCYSRFRLVSIPDKKYTIISHETYESVYYPSYPFEKQIS